MIAPGFNHEPLQIYRVSTLEEAVAKAKEVAVKGEVVMLSPASASFEMFKNFEERGDKFRSLVNALGSNV